MGLNKHFSASRFNKYLQYDLRLHGKTYVFAIIGLFIVLLLIDLFTLNTVSPNINFSKSYYKPMFLFFLILSSVISAGTSFSALRSSKNSISYLMLPVSSFEKFLVQFLIRVVAFVMLFVPIYWGAFKMACHVYKGFGDLAKNIESYSLLSIFEWKGSNTEDVFVFIALASTLVTFAFAGATYFKKYALFKSVFAFALLSLGLFSLMVLLSHIFYNHSIKEFFEVKLNNYYVYKTVLNIEVYVITLLSGLSLLLIPLAYFKLKERTV